MAGRSRAQLKPEVIGLRLRRSLLIVQKELNLTEESTIEQKQKQKLLPLQREGGIPSGMTEGKSTI